MQRTKKEDEISPQLTKPVRRCVQSKLPFGKNTVEEGETENEKQKGIKAIEDVEKDINSSQPKLLCVKPLVEEGREVKLKKMDEVKEKCEVIAGEEKGVKIIRICQSKLPWHKPPVEEAKVTVNEENDQTGESGGKKNTNYQRRTPQKSPLKKQKEERRSSARIKSNMITQLLINKQNGADDPEISPGNGDTEHGGSSSKKNLKKKKLGASKDVSSQNMNVPHQITDLRLEARLAAEEYSRLSVGKQTHPFFTSRKAAKQVSEFEAHTIKKEAKCWPGLDGDYTVPCPPIHVIDSPEDDIVLIDWKNWVFEETPLSIPSSDLTIENTSSVLDGFIKPLNFDNIPFKRMYMNQAITEDNEQHSYLDSEKLKSVNVQLLSDSYKNDQPYSLLTERLTSYYQRISCWPESSLWANKYQPENALEVCGNSESVQFLREWLKSWNENPLQSGKKKHVLEPCVAEDSDDSTYEIESDMDDEVGLKNVLLIKGPVGSGKSAAIYACAKEQGFEVIEVNTSDLRNGAHMKQVFGQAMDSHALNKWSVEAPAVRKRKLIFDLSTSPTNIREDGDLCGGVLLTNSNSGQQDLTNEDILSWDAQVKCSARCTANKSLILFEDVDTVFDEDRGFISSILLLAETAKRPIILTSNCKTHVLPQLLDHIVLNFVLPSKEDLLSHLSMICASEKINISSDLLEHLIRCCVGDIRKTLMLLQFWCQDKDYQLDKTLNSSYSPLTFDIDAAYLVTHRMISWELPCKLSEKVADEIDRAIARTEERNIKKIEAMQEQFSALQMIKKHPKRRKDLCSPVKAKKKRTLLKINSSMDFAESLDHFNDFEDLYDLFDSPTNNAHKTVKRQTGIVMSSQSEDLSDDEHPCILQSHENLPNNRNFSYPSEKLDTVGQSIDNFGAASISHICDTYKSHDVSYVPESCFMNGFLDISSQNMSSTSANLLLPVEINNPIRADIDVNKCLEDNCENAVDTDVESVNGNEEVEENSQNENYFSSSQSQLMDECSHIDFNTKLLPGMDDKNIDEVDLVQETWNSLRGVHDDLKSCVHANTKDASSVMKHVSGLADLICEADIMFKSCYCLNNDVPEPSMIPSFEPDLCSFYEQQVEMGSTYAQHGFCYHTSNIAEAGYNLGHSSVIDLAQEMLNSSLNTMALGKLISKGNTHQKSCLEEKLRATIPRKLESELYSAMLTTVPARLSMVLRNSAFHEYVSFYSKISKLDCVRLSQGIVEKRRTRSRASQHYLSSGSFSMSDEHVQLLAHCNCFN